MPVPPDITALSAIVASNSPPGSETPSSIDDYLRSHAAFIAQMRAVIGGAVNPNIPTTFADGAALANQSDPLKGAALLGYRGRTQRAKNDDNLSPMDFGAKGDGATNDDAAFASFESSVSGDPVSLGGKTYVVTSIPRKNAYYNGTWLIAGDRRVALLGRSFLGGGARFHPFGGQPEIYARRSGAHSSNTPA